MSKITIPIPTDEEMKAIEDSWLDHAKNNYPNLSSFFDFIMKEYYKKRNVTSEFLEDLKEKEDAVLAYENNWYDTHDLNYIGENIEDYREVLSKNKYLLDDEADSYSFYIFEDGLLKKTYNPTKKKPTAS